MKAWRFMQPGLPLTLVEIPSPVPADDEIVIDVRAAGICHSDLAVVDGSLTHLLRFWPMTLGHEIAGTVAEVGADVSGFLVGDRVVVPVGDGTPGTGRDGGFATKVAARAAHAILVHDSIDWALAAIATDAGLSSHQAVMGKGRVAAGMKVGVIGYGGLGSLGAQIAIAAGADVYVAERNADLYAGARAAGCSGIAPSIEAFADLSLDVIIDFVGVGASISDAIRAVRKRGRIVLVGLGASEGQIPFHDIVFKEIELVGSTTGTMDDCRAMLELLASGRVKPDITRITFDEIGEGLARLERGEAVGRLVAIL